MIKSNKKDFSMKLNRLLLVIMLLHSFANALSLDEILDQDYIEPSFDCDKAQYREYGVGEYKYKYEDEYAICGGLWSNTFLALQDNLYASYYQIVMKNIDSTDRDRIKQISLNMIKHRRKCIDETIKHILQVEKEMGEEMSEEEYRFNPVIHKYISDCILLYYLEAFKQITEFIYNNPKYKGLFEQIFYPNPKEYYDILFTKQLDDRLLKFTEKVAQDNLIDKNGKLKNTIIKDKSGGI